MHIHMYDIYDKKWWSGVNIWIHIYIYTYTYIRTYMSILGLVMLGDAWVGVYFVNYECQYLGLGTGFWGRLGGGLEDGVSFWSGLLTLSNDLISEWISILMMGVCLMLGRMVGLQAIDVVFALVGWLIEGSPVNKRWINDERFCTKPTPSCLPRGQYWFSYMNFNFDDKIPTVLFKVNIFYLNSELH